MEELAQVLDGRFGSTTTVLPKDLSHPHAVGDWSTTSTSAAWRSTRS